MWVILFSVLSNSCDPLCNLDCNLFNGKTSCYHHCNCPTPIEIKTFSSTKQQEIDSFLQELIQSTPIFCDLNCYRTCSQPTNCKKCGCSELFDAEYLKANLPISLWDSIQPPVLNVQDNPMNPKMAQDFQNCRTRCKGLCDASEEGEQCVQSCTFNLCYPHDGNVVSKLQIFLYDDSSSGGPRWLIGVVGLGLFAVFICRKCRRQSLDVFRYKLL